MLTVRHVAALVAAGTAAVAAVPVIQGAVVSRGRRPFVPGPHHQDGLIAAADAGDHEPVPFVWLGDSLASGVGAGSADTAFPRRAVTLFHELEGRPVHLTCLAVAGACAADVLSEQLPRAVEQLQAGSVAVVTVGSNDVSALTHPRRFKRTYAAILDALAATGATVVAVGLPDIGSAVVIPQPLRTLARWVGRRADRQIQRQATVHGAHFVSIDQRAPWRTKAAVYLAADRYHPNDDTYGLWAQSVAAMVAPLFALRST
jgi:lysophospholipase L1-like esterase